MKERTVEQILAAWVADTPAAAIPGEARASAARQAADAIGVTLAAVAQPPGRILVDLAAQAGGQGLARVVGTPITTSLLDAAWTNGSLAHLLDFDDTGFSHPTACLMPAGLAIAESNHLRGRTLLEALVLGYEVFERLAVCARPWEPLLRERGIHPTSIWGAPAAAAVAGRLLELDAEQLVVALGIAATGASGLTQQFGSWGKGINAGNAARAGVQAALLAQAGYEADLQAISGPYGLFSAIVGHGRYDLTGVEDQLGDRWSIVEPGLSIKPYPACTSTLRAVDAMLQIVAEPSYAPAAVRRIVIDVHPDLLHTLRFRRPLRGFNGKFSLDYTVASTALDGRLTIGSFSDHAALRPDLRAMLEKVRLREHPEWDIARRHENPVSVELDDGTTLTADVPAFHGSRGWPLTDDEVRAKYLGCAILTLGDAAEASADAIWRIDEAADVSDITGLLVPGV